MLIRPVEPKDKAAWLPLWQGYNAFYERVVPDEVTWRTWSRFFDGYEPVHANVAEHEGALCGLVHYIYHRNTAMLGPVCYLQDLFTSSVARGKGVGKALITSVYDAARAAGSERVYWQTHETNATAMKLYDQVATLSGFVVYRMQIG